MLKRRLREPFGKAGLTVAVLALVMALVGGAYAAGGLTKAQEKQVTKIAKKYAGKPGAAGGQGPVGISGAKGDKGEKGDQGSPGTAGAPGTSGKSVVIAEAAPNCLEGGITVEVEGSGIKHEVCNGEEGEEGEEGGEGKEGSPWTAGGTLPKGATEAGTYSQMTVEDPLERVNSQPSISLGIAAAAAPTVVYLTQEEAEPGSTTNTHATECPGNVEDPQAAEGSLCVYALHQGAGASFEGSEAFVSGAILNFRGGFPGFPTDGTWAVTGA